MVNVRSVVAAVALVAVSVGLLAGCGKSPADHGPSMTETKPWTLVSVSGHRVDIKYLMGGCSRDPRTAHRESSTQVVITVRVRLRLTGACPAILFVRTAHVDLAEPVGRRQLIDGSTGSAPSHSLFTTGGGRSDGN